MKLTTALFLLILFANQIAIAQDYEKDSLLFKVSRDLPEGWTANLVDNIYTIRYKDSTWTAEGNWIKASKDQFETKSDSV